MTLEEILERIGSAKRLLIISHTNSDGDTLGSAAALSYLARSLGVDAYCTAPEMPTERLSFIVPSDRFLPPPKNLSDINSFDTVCAVDVASPSQLGSLLFLSEAGRIDFMIDHHSTGEPFAPYFVDSSASAVGEIIYSIYKLARELHLVPVLPDLLRACYTAIVSDTGSFKYSNVTPETHIAASELVGVINSTDDGGLTTEELTRTLFGRRTMRDLKAQALAIRSLTVSPDGKIGAVLLKCADYTAEGLSASDFGAAVETPRSLAGVQIALSIRQSESAPDEFKISSRSNCSADVSLVCAGFGGGGHPKAAGCTINAPSPEEALRMAVDAFSKVLPSEE